MCLPASVVDKQWGHWIVRYSAHGDLPCRHTTAPHRFQLDCQAPQIARVWKAKSLVGLSPASIYADVFLFATSVIYHVLKHNPFRAYGESVVVLVQTLVMVGLLWTYGTAEDGEENVPPGGGVPGRLAIIGGSIAATAATMKYLPEHLWGLLVVVSTPAILAVQVPQIVKNWRQHHTGELATLTILLSFGGSMIRVGTTIAVSRFCMLSILAGEVFYGILFDA